MVRSKDKVLFVADLSAMPSLWPKIKVPGRPKNQT